MQILHGLDGLRKLPPRAVLSVGNFDGLHLGHRRLLQTARALATAEGVSQAVVTFEPHPLKVLRPQEAPPRLTPPSVKQPLIEALGPDYLVILPPSPEVLGVTAEEFWLILRDQLKAAHLVEGAGFRFGKGAAGDIKKLAEWSRDSSVTLHLVESVRVPLLDLQVTPVSSSLVRFLLTFGRVRDAAICLGRPYMLSGLVGKGYARGRDLGTPTANLKCDDQLIPTDGVYIGRCMLNGTTYPAAVSIGTMPTFGENVRQIEAHLIGYSGDLYGQSLGVELIDWLREQRKFSSIDQLKAKIEEDLAETEARYTGNPSRAIARVMG